MNEVVFLLEEDSAKVLLAVLFPLVVPDASVQARFIVFEGKQDLEKQMTKKLRGYLNRSARFIVMRDRDSAPDCR